MATGESGQDPSLEPPTASPPGHLSDLCRDYQLSVEREGRLRKQLDEAHERTRRIERDLHKQLIRHGRWTVFSDRMYRSGAHGRVETALISYAYEITIPIEPDPAPSDQHPAIPQESGNPVVDELARNLAITSSF
jgi:hypothetical protein